MGNYYLCYMNVGKVYSNLYLSYMKYIITENQTDNVIEKVLKKSNIQYTIEYGEREFYGETYFYKLNVWFTIDGYNVYRPFEYYYRVKDNNIVGLEWSDGINDMHIFKFLPTEMVNDYFRKKTREYLQEMFDTDTI